MSNSISEEMRLLEKQIAYHSKRYYDDDAPEISDYEYDMMFDRLKKLESEHPELASPSSPTQRVGGHVAERFEKVTHRVRLDSLTDVFDYEGVEDFVCRIKSQYPDVDFSVENKIDGLSVALEYKDGVFVKGATRGDGIIGEDVTQNLKTVRSIPLELNEKLPHIIVRGEVYMPKSSFIKLNGKREEKGLPLFANPRNAAAGSLRQLNSSLCAERRLEIFVFNVQYCETAIPDKHGNALRYLEKLGFTISPDFEICSDTSEIIDKIKRIGESREKLSFGIDGAVIKVNSLAYREELGDIGAVPRWAVAYKYPPEEVETVVKDIVIQVGRTGVLTPKAMLEPVLIAGSTVSASTLHNIDYIKSKDIRIGDTVILRKAGDIIPEIVSVVKDKRGKQVTEYEMPIKCPSCGCDVFREEGNAAVRCVNSACPAQLHRSITHFASRDCMDIRTLGENIIARFIEEGMLHSVADIYALDESRIASLSGMGSLSAKNIISSAESSKSKPLSKLIYALGIDQVGEKAAKTLAKHYSNMENLMNASIEELCSLTDIGKVTAESIFGFFASESNRKIISCLEGYGLNMEEASNATGTAFSGMTVVVTGKLVSLKRDKAEALIEANGGKAASSVSAKTSLLVCGEDAGSKLAKAVSLGVKVISEEKFLQMIKGDKQ